MKFLRGKALQVILAVCMLVMLLCITASAAESAIAGVDIGGTVHTVTKGGDPCYFKNDSAGNVSLCGEADHTSCTDHTIEFVYPADAETPELHLHGAYLNSAIASSGDYPTDLTIVVHDEDSPVTVDEGTVDADSYMTKKITWLQGNLVIQGDGKFKMNVADNCFRTYGHVLTFKDLNVEITTDLAYTVVFADDSNVVDGIVFDNCTASVESKQYAITVGINSIRVINGANVTMTSNNTTLYCDTTGAKLEVDSSTLNVTTSNGTPLRWSSATTDNGGIFVKNGTLELLGTTKAMYANYSSIVTNYKNAEDAKEDYAVVVGSKASDAAAYDNTTDLTTYKYFKIEPTYTITVESGTASVGGVTVEKATANTTVTLTADPAQGNQAFAGWEVVSGPAGFTIANASAEEVTFKMPAGNVSVKATYGNAATVKIGNTNFTAVEGNAAQYFQTDNAGGVTKAGNKNDYNIKFEYPTEGTPTISLRDAYITSTGTYAIQSVSNSADKVIIVVEKTETTSIEVGAGKFEDTDSYLGKGISWSHGELEIQGSETAQAIENIGKLMVKSTITMTSKPITFKNLNLEMVTASNTQLFNGTPALITFDGGKAVLETGYVVYFINNNTSEIMQGIKVTNNADVSMLSGDMTIYANKSPNVKVVVESGKLSAKTTNSNKYVMQFADVNNRIVVKSGTVEFATPSANTIGGQIPVLTEYLNASGENNYRAVYSTTTDKPTEQDLKTYTSGGLSYRYFKLEPAYKVTVDGEVVHAKVTVDTPVTITAATVAGKAFDGWTLVSGPTGFAIATPSEEEVTFNMPAGNVSVKANYIKVANIILSGATHNFKANQTIHLKTVDGVITSEGASESDYNIMLAFDEETGIPTVYLKGAYIVADNTAIQNGENTPEFAIKTEKADSQMNADGEFVDSYIVHANATSSTGNAVLTSGKVIFYGDGLLKTKGISSKAKSIVSSSGRTQPIEFRNANVKIYGNGGEYGIGAITGSASKVIFNGGTVYIKSTYAPIFEVAVDVTGGADVDLISTLVQPLYSPSDPVTIDGGSLYVEGKVNKIIDVSALNIKSGDMEASTTTSAVSSDIPNFTGYENWYAVMGASKETATKYESGALSGKYFRVGKKATVTVTNGTAQAFDDQSTENEGIHTLETMVGAEVTVTAKSAAPGHAFAEWEVTGLDNIDLNNDSIVFLMPAGDVSATATYGQTAEVNIGGTLYMAVEGGEKHFLKTEDGNVIGGGTEGAYNIRFEYLKYGTPTIYLRDAYINTESYAIQSVATAADKVIIVVEKVDNPSKKNGEQVDSYLGKGIHWSHSALEIQGRVQNSVWSKLKMTAGIYMNAQEITFKNLDLNIDMTGSIFTGTPALITFDGGKAVLTASRPVYWPTTDDVVKGFVINDADVTMSSSDLTIYAPDCVNAKIVVNNGKLTATTDAAKAVMQFKNVNNSLVLNGGTVEFSTPYSDGIGYIVPTIGYAETDEKTYYASVSKNVDGTGASEYNGTYGLNNYKYFKVRPGYWITVKGGTPNRLRAPANETFTVNLTPGNAPDAGEGFKYWTSEAWDEGVKVQGSSYEFLMPNEPITIVANWGDLAQVQMNASTSVSVVAGGATSYYTVADNVITAGDEDNYNIMFAYTEGGTPTLTLKGVTLTSGGRIHCGADTPELIVEVQGVNKLTYTGGSTVAFAGNNLTFTGGGTLELKTGVVGISMTNEGLNAGLVGTALKFDDVNVSVQTTGAYQMCINPAGSDIVVDGGVLTMVSSGKANSGAGIYTTNANGTLTVTGDAIVTVTDVSNGIRIGNITMESGIVTIGKEGAPEGTGLYLNNASGWVITGGTMEIFAGSVCERTPGLNGYTSEYLAVACTSKADYKANPYNYDYDPGAELKYTNYFLIQPKEARVQITWAPMTFTYQGAEWNVDTLQWEGIWVATEVDGWYTNQIIVENTGTEDVTVSFDFAKEEPQMTSSPVEGKFVSSNDKETAESVGTTTLRRCASVTAFLSLESKAVNPFEGSPTLGTVVVTITAETDVQIDEVEPVQDGGNAE